MAEIGHNQPPDEFGRLTEEIDGLMKTSIKWEDPELVMTVENAANADDFKKLLLGAARDCKAAHKEEKAPSLEEGRIVDAKWKGLTVRLDVARGVVGGLLTEWLAAEKRRKEKIEHEERLRAEQARRDADRLAQAAKNADEAEKARQAQERARQDAVEVERAAAEGPKVKGSMGGRSTSLRTSYHAVITDQDMAYAFFRRAPSVEEAIEKAANAFIHAAENEDYRLLVKRIPGVTVKTEETAV